MPKLMPILLTYQGRAVKRRCRVGIQIKLIFYASSPGTPGEQLIISQLDWDRDGREAYLERAAMPDVRRDIR